MDAETGRQKWRYKGQPFESSPLLRDGILYVGSWDGNVHAIRAKTGKRVWTYQTGNRVNTSAAYSKGRIFIANQDGTLFALNAKTGRLAWSASEATEFFYAAPAVAYGRVFIGSTDGTMYAYGAAHRQAAVGQAAGHLHLLVGGDLRQEGLRRHLRRQVLRARRRHRRRALAAHDGERGARAAGGDGRPGLRGHLRDLRLGGVALREDGQGRHDRLQRQHRQGALAQQRRQVRQPDHRRPGPGLPDGPLVPVRARSAEKASAASPA